MKLISIFSPEQQVGTTHAAIYAVTATLLDLERQAQTKNAVKNLRESGHFNVAILAPTFDGASTIRGLITALYERLSGGAPYKYEFHLRTPQMTGSLAALCANGVCDSLGGKFQWGDEFDEWLEGQEKVTRMYVSSNRGQ